MLWTLLIQSIHLQYSSKWVYWAFKIIPTSFHPSQFSARFLQFKPSFILFYDIFPKVFFLQDFVLSLHVISDYELHLYNVGKMESWIWFWVSTLFRVRTRTFRHGRFNEILIFFRICRKKIQKVIKLVTTKIKPSTLQHVWHKKFE